MLDQTMRAKLLSARFLIKDFIQGEEACNYEKYLLEMINHSKWFSQTYPGTFVAPLSESHGECDANNEAYGLDFKLLASKTELQARSLLSPQIHKIGFGVAYGACKKPKTEIRATRLFAAFRFKTMADLDQIRSSNDKKYGIENDIKTALNKLETEKNLLLFFPYQFSFDVSHTWEEATKSITEALKNDFGVTFEYRGCHASGYETFLTCIYDGHFLIFKIEKSSCILIDYVSVKEAPSFYTLLKHYSDW